MALPVISPSFHLDDIADDDDNNFGVERDLLKSSTRLTTVFVATKLQPTGVVKFKEKISSPGKIVALYCSVHDGGERKWPKIGEGKICFVCFFTLSCSRVSGLAPPLFREFPSILPPPSTKE